MLVAYLLNQNSDQSLRIESTSGNLCVSNSYDAVLKFLVHSAPFAMRDDPRVVWKLSEFVSYIKTILPPFAVKELEGEYHRATWEANDHRYRLYHRPQKFFAISYDHREVTFYELDQFFHDVPEPQTIKQVQLYADQLRGAFARLGITKVSNLKSPIAVVEDSGLLDDIYINLPDPGDIPSGVKEYATMVDAFGAWVSAYQLGYFPDAYTYDVTSSYPAQAIKLLSLDGAEYKYSRKMLDGATYGFLHGDLYIEPSYWDSPIVAPADDIVTNPVGKLSGYFTLAQVQHVTRCKKGRFELKSGHFVFTTQETRPFLDVMTKYYNARADSELMSMICKRIIDGIIGRLGEFREDKPTEFTNPVYHTLIRTGAALHVSEFIEQNNITQPELIYVNTDEVITPRHIPLPKTNGIGQWRAEQEPVLVLSPSIIFEGEACNALVSQIKENPKSTKVQEYRLVTLAGVQNRDFPKFPRSAGDLLKNIYESEPILA